MRITIQNSREQALMDWPEATVRHVVTSDPAEVVREMTKAGERVEMMVVIRHLSSDQNCTGDKGRA